jgi:membrane fusion protein (multidrug efflux system)
MTLEVDAFPGRTFSGRVVRIGPSLDEKTRALTVEAQVVNPNNALRPGMFAKSSLITAANAPAVMVPNKALVTVAGLTKVFVIENGKATEHIVKTGATDSDLIEIRRRHHDRPDSRHQQSGQAANRHGRQPQINKQEKRGRSYAEVG